MKNSKSVTLLTSIRKLVTEKNDTKTGKTGKNGATQPARSIKHHWTQQTEGKVKLKLMNCWKFSVD